MPTASNRPTTYTRWTQELNAKFVKTWESGTSVKQVAKKMDMTDQSTSMRASYLRGKGVHLKRMNLHPLDVKALNLLIGKA